MQFRDCKLSRDGVAAIRVYGSGTPGEKSMQLFRKAPILEACGLLFPRRNMVVTSDVVLEGLDESGLMKDWSRKAPDARNAHSAFHPWVKRNIWPLVEEVFEGRAFYIRSDAPGDSLGRGVYHSVPFVNRHVDQDDEQRAEIFSRGFLEVVSSYFSESAALFRKKLGITREGMNVFLSQFIGRVGGFILEARQRSALMPFLSAVVKTRIVAEGSEGLIRFEYGLGSGALTGRTIIVGENSVETIIRQNRASGVNATFTGMRPQVLVLPGHYEEVSDNNWVVFDHLMRSAYQLGEDAEQAANRLLEWLARNMPSFERANKGPLYLELVASSFKRDGSMRWFAVQASDYDPVDPVMKPPPHVDFISQQDFSGHGVVTGRRDIYVFGKDTFTDGAALSMLEQINAREKGFVVVLPQHALTGTNLTQLSGTHFSNAAAVIEYERLSETEFPERRHQERLSSEHFNQLMLDFEILFIPVDFPFGEEKRVAVAPNEVVKATADATLACDKERGIAWGVINEVTGLETVARITEE